MKTYNVNVFTTIRIEAKNEEEAEKKVAKELRENPLEVSDLEWEIHEGV